MIFCKTDFRFRLCTMNWYCVIEVTKSTAQAFTTGSSLGFSQDAGPELEGGTGGQIPPGNFETKFKILLKCEKSPLSSDESWIIPPGMKFLTKVLNLNLECFQLSFDVHIVHIVKKLWISKNCFAKNEKISMKIGYYSIA